MSSCSVLILVFCFSSSGAHADVSTAEHPSSVESSVPTRSGLSSDSRLLNLFTGHGAEPATHPHPHAVSESEEEEEEEEESAEKPVLPVLAPGMEVTVDYHGASTSFMEEMEPLNEEFTSTSMPINPGGPLAGGPVGMTHGTLNATVLPGQNILVLLTHQVYLPNRFIVIEPGSVNQEDHFIIGVNTMPGFAVITTKDPVRHEHQQGVDVVMEGGLAAPQNASFPPYELMEVIPKSRLNEGLPLLGWTVASYSAAYCIAVTIMILSSSKPKDGKKKGEDDHEDWETMTHHS